MDIEYRIKEAEVYRSMELTGESLMAYGEIMTEASGLYPQDLGFTKDKIVTLKRRKKDLEKKYARNISHEDMSAVKQALQIRENPSEILKSAEALRELGLMKEALAEYEKLFELHYPPEKIIPELVKCLKHRSLSRTIQQIRQIIGKKILAERERIQINSLLGLEMEKMGRSDLALDLYSSVLHIDPDNKEIRDRLDIIKASIAFGSKYNYLLKQKLVNPEQLKEALAISKKTTKSVESVLIDSFGVRKEDIGKSLSLFFGCPFKVFDTEVPVPVELLRSLKKSFLLYNLWAPLSWSPKGVEILVDDPGDLRKTDQIRGLMKTKKVIFSVGIKEDIEQFIMYFYDVKHEEHFQPMIDELDMIPDISFEEDEDQEIEEDDFDESSNQVVNLVDHVIVAAYRKNASDIHIEPSPISKATTIRFRIDGVCQDYVQVPNSMARAILSRIKIMCGIDIAEKRLPQDGKIKFKRKGVSPFELRVATIPTTGGFEDAVLRILAKAGAIKLDEMGLNERNLKILKKVIEQPYGLILAVGPTGSGKTTTLHSALGHINKPDIKIWTAEDPVEITQPGLRQIEVKPKIGLDFARIMRAFLRADPDVIMIGEMRDLETASTAIEASLTGHLVFSTLHTNSAPETITRLLDMGLNPLNFSDAFLCVLAQRLTRRLCTSCRKGYHPSKEEFDEIVTEYGKGQLETAKMGYTPGTTLYRAVGCDACSGTGYKGRMGIYELMAASPQIKELIKKQAPSENLFAQAVKEGMTTLKQDGIYKVFQGLTDIDEIRRVCIE